MKDEAMKYAIKDLKKEIKNRSVQKDGYEIMRHIADGHAGSVFRAQKYGEDYVLKIMCPSFIPGGLMYYLFFQEKHGYFDKDAVEASFWRRKMANRIVKDFDKNIEIIDAVEQSREYYGFYMPFVDSLPAKNLEERDYVLTKANNLKKFFNEIGMPSWSFNPDYPFYKNRSKNLRINNERIILIDYESAVLTPRKEKGLDLDSVDFDCVHKHVKNNQKGLLDCLGKEEFRVLKESFEKCRHYTQVWHSHEKRTLQKITSRKELQKTIENMVEEGILSAQEKENLNFDEKTAYVLKNLATHLAIGFTFGFFTGPIPIGLFPRGLWTIGNRIYHELKRDKEKAKIHSLGVLGISSMPIPVANYFGYLLPLKRINETIALIYGEHMTNILKGKTLNEYLQSRDKLTSKLIKRFIIPKTKWSFYQKRP